MARIMPFRALRYAADGSLDVSSRLVSTRARVTEAERRAMSHWDRHHALHVKAAPSPHDVVRTWTEAGVLVRDSGPGLYALSVESPWAGGQRLARYLFGLVSPEERLAPLEAGDEPPSRPPVVPVPALAADDHHVLASLLAEAVESQSPLLEARFEDRDLTLVRVENSPLMKRLQAAVADAPVRPLASLSGPDPTLLAISPLSEAGPSVLPIHRALRQVATFDPGRFLTIVREYARVYELDARLDTAGGLVMARERLANLAAGYHAVLLVLPKGEGRILRFRQALDLAHVPAAPKSPTLRSLDLALLNALVLKTVLGVQDPENPGHAHVFTVPTLELLVEGVEAGTYQAGFGLNPPPLWELRAVMEAQATLPPHTLQLDPLPPDGILFVSPEG